MTIKQFAWWPKRVSSGKWTWLQYYRETKTRYDESSGRPPLRSLWFVYTETEQEYVWSLLCTGPPLRSLWFVYTETEQEYVWSLLKQQIVHNRNIWNDPDGDHI